MRSKLSLVLILMLLLAHSSLAAASASEGFTIQVQATGVMVAAPSKAQLWIGVQSTRDRAKEALDSNNEIVQYLLNAFSKYTSPELIKTSEFSMYQNEQWHDELRRFTTQDYTVRHVFEVHLLDLDKVTSLLDDATQAGANIIYGLQYGVADYHQPKEEAFKKAMEEAWWKARIIAASSSAHQLVLEAVEETTYTYGGEYSLADLRGEAAETVKPGQLQVTATVIATFRAFPSEQ